VPDDGGQRQDALPDPGQDASWCSSAVAFEVELAFEGVEHRLDCLPSWFEELFAGSSWFTFAGRPQESETGCG